VVAVPLAGGALVVTYGIDDDDSEGEREACRALVETLGAVS
jgi:hypothetical protein